MTIGGLGATCNKSAFPRADPLSLYPKSGKVSRRTESKEFACPTMAILRLTVVNVSNSHGVCLSHLYLYAEIPTGSRPRRLRRFHVVLFGLLKRRRSGALEDSARHYCIVCHE